MVNNQFLKEKLEEITFEHFVDAFDGCLMSQIKSVAPLGRSGDTFLLHGTEKGGRCEQVSFRRYNDDIEMLITDQNEVFLFYGRFDLDSGREFVVGQYYMIFELLKDKIRTEVPQKEVSEIAGSVLAKNRIRFEEFWFSGAAFLNAKK